MRAIPRDTLALVNTSQHKNTRQRKSNQNYPNVVGKPKGVVAFRARVFGSRSDGLFNFEFLFFFLPGCWPRSKGWKKKQERRRRRRGQTACFQDNKTGQKERGLELLIEPERSCRKKKGGRARPLQFSNDVGFYFRIGWGVKTTPDVTSDQWRVKKSPDKQGRFERDK